MPMYNLFDVYPRFDIKISKAKGSFLYDFNGNKYLDLYGGHGVISIGHGQKEYIKAITSQIKKIGFYSNSVNLPIQEKFAHKLNSISGYPDYKVFLCNSGAEANENALKLASFHTGKKNIIAFKGSFHGRTSAAVAVTDNPELSAPINKPCFKVTFISLNNIKEARQAIETTNPAAVIFEGIQGVGGLDYPTNTYLQQLEKLCKENNTLIIADEIQSGYGRSGKFFAHQYSGIKPDIITMAKGMGNGFPMGGVLIHPDIKANYGMLGTTFGGNPLACASGISVLNVIQQKQLIDRVNKINLFLLKQLKEIDSIKKIKGKGLMLGLEFDFPVKELRKMLITDFNIITGSSSNKNLLRILPPLTINKKELNVFPNALKSCLLKLKSS